MKKLITIIFLIGIFTPVFSMQYIKWNEPVFDNNSDLLIKKISISTKAQSEENTVEFIDRKFYLHPFDSKRLKGVLGGGFKNDSIDYKEFSTVWTIKIEGISQLTGNRVTLYREVEYFNELCDGPALSRWPRFPNVFYPDSSSLILRENNRNKYFLLVHLESTEDRNFLNSEIELYELDTESAGKMI